MTETSNLGLPFIDGSQAQKHVTHNEALRILDDAIQIGVLDSTLTVPPSSPVDGDRHIVAAGATGAWAGQDNAVATRETYAWRFLPPKAGWCVWSIADDALLVFGGSAWTPVTTASVTATLDNVPSIGINTTVADSNLLSVRYNDALRDAIGTADGGTGDVRLQLSKSATGNTSSVVFSDAFSGRAEFGLSGDDDFHLKVSADGTAWRDALKFDRTTGRVSFPSGGARETLVADRTYYVRSADGSDSNDGLSNSSGGAFHTIAKAIAAATALDLSIYRVTISLTGNFAENAVLKSYVGAGPIVIVGDETTPSNCTVTGQTCSTAVFLADTTLGRWDIRGVEITSAVSGQHGINSTNNSVVGFQNVDFGSLNAGYHLAPTDGGILVATGYYKISGGAMYHAAAIQGGLMRTAFRSVAISNTPAFSGAFAYATALSSIRGQSMSFTGTGATGKRYQVDLASAIIVGGAGATYLPGDSAGTADSASSGIYS